MSSSRSGTWFAICLLPPQLYLELESVNIRQLHGIQSRYKSSPHLNIQSQSVLIIRSLLLACKHNHKGRRCLGHDPLEFEMEMRFVSRKEAVLAVKLPHPRLTFFPSSSPSSSTAATCPAQSRDVLHYARVPRQVCQHWRDGRSSSRYSCQEGTRCRETDALGRLSLCTPAWLRFYHADSFVCQLPRPIPAQNWNSGLKRAQTTYSSLSDVGVI